jgi:excisionase family DNA binding protein
MGKVKNYITTGEAAAIFDVDSDTVLRWIKSGKIPAIRTLGGHYRINRNVFMMKMIKDTTINEKDET